MQYATRAEAREVAARAVASLGRGKDRAGAGKKMVQAWYRMAAEVNREFSCEGQCGKLHAFRWGYTRRDTCMKLLLCAFCSVLYYITKHLLTLKSKHRFKRIKLHFTSGTDSVHFGKTGSQGSCRGYSPASQGGRSWYCSWKPIRWQSPLVFKRTVLN